MKVAELIGAKLDHWAAKAEGLSLARPYSNGRPWDSDAWCIGGDPQRSMYDGPESRHAYAPSSSWEHGGPIIERERITLKSREDERGALDWSAHVGPDPLAALTCWGETPLIAAMRAYVASKYGREVPE